MRFSGLLLAAAGFVTGMIYVASCVSLPRATPAYAQQGCVWEVALWDVGTATCPGGGDLQTLPPGEAGNAWHSECFLPEPWQPVGVHSVEKDGMAPTRHVLVARCHPKS